MQKLRQRQMFLVSLFSFSIGVVIILAAFGIGPMGEAEIHAPEWLIGLSGAIFAAIGMLGFGTGHNIATVVGGIVMIGMTVICAWVAFYGDDKYFSGGASLFSQRADIIMARVIFGAVALMGAVISINGVRKLIQNKGSQRAHRVESEE